jgi:hypothetical protein
MYILYVCAKHFHIHFMISLTLWSDRRFSPCPEMTKNPESGIYLHTGSEKNSPLRVEGNRLGTSQVPHST